MNNITIRRATLDDVPAITKMHADYSAYANTLQLPYPTEKTWEARLGENDPLVTQFVATIGEEVVGLLVISQPSQVRRRHVATFGITVSEAHQGKGIGSQLMQVMVDYCDNWLNVHRIELEVFAANGSGVGLYEKFGFEQEGRMRDYAFRDGQYVDAVMMSRIKS
ncbi:MULTISPECIES: GNAT family N-acetyltransferase [Providencia]|uniref:GNAT family N-acetyltransferase n=1 Tax=Providencia huaxiensis TaxID=2027290 RepID=A0ABU2IUN9_9GAMM|nr:MULTISPECIES: GNAT family N-acetyltransferase [Providencia]MBZ3683257.1 GNAT family N-acetyltransferase [Providencia rettgeri]MDT0132370.1 GNAT family N-acetyltransferase [Providencia huaxiensis]MDT1978776.1 GNAT family N-acetyltransferase [Providencia huaxiensis]QLR01889.1 GNAT family N-acetyltransferase [Providencia rettgeri]